MKKLLSLPANLVGCFHGIENVSDDEWYCDSDPSTGQLGSGGGTVWLMNGAFARYADGLSKNDWLAAEKRIVLHAGGQSRRLPAYAPLGKILTPVPVFRWARGQRLSQNLLSLQLPLYENIMERAPDVFHTLIASGDVYIRNSGLGLPQIPVADVVCFGLWGDPVTATHHGVFLSSRNEPDELDCMLQKPTLSELASLAQTHFFMMDVGIWLLSDKAFQVLSDKSTSDEGKGLKYYDLYSEFGRALGKRPQIADAEVNGLTVKIVPLPGAEFYHYGTGAELISSTLAVQNLVRDQRAIMHRAIKPHPAMFVQNAEVNIPLRSVNSELWIENSCIGKGWTIESRHILTGIPHNNWELKLPAGVCVDIVPVGDAQWAARPYGFNDSFRGNTSDSNTLFLQKPLVGWLSKRNIHIKETDIQDAKLFPVCKSTDELGTLLSWMIDDNAGAEGQVVWEQAVKLSATDLLNQSNLKRLIEQRDAFRCKNWSELAANHEKSVFYQLDLDNAAREFAAGDIPLPDALGADVPVMKQIHNRMFRAQVLRLSGASYQTDEQQAFTLLREGMLASMRRRKESPTVNVCRDQIVWSRSPVRIDLAGGWTDTPPYCIFAGGNVVNIAIELNGQPPLQVYVKPSRDFTITLRSIDLGALEVIRTREELGNYNKVGSPFSIPKAALALAGFAPEFSAVEYSSLEEQLRASGAGVEITLLSAIPVGSGLGTSSILAATVLGGLSDFFGLGWDRNEIGNRTLILEQLLTTGGGWQDQFGGALHGLKLLQTVEGFDQSPLVRWLPETLFTDPQYSRLHLLYYTGITRTAKEILAEIVRAMFLNSARSLAILEEMKAHALDMFDAIQCGSFERYGRLVLKTWEQNKALDAGTNPDAVEHIISKIKDLCLGYKLPGAGGGGYLYIIAKDYEAAGRIRHILNSNPVNPNARFVEMNLSGKGLQVSRS